MIASLDLFGVAVFAVTGALAAGRKRMDLFGVLLLATVTAVGGGTTRDLLLGQPVFWVSQPRYLGVITAVALLTVVAARRVSFLLDKPLIHFDAFGLALFSVMGAGRANAVDAPFAVCVVMGVLTGVFGGILRDVISNQVPLILRSELYATCAVLGATAYLALERLGLPVPWPTTLGFAAALALRLAALRWHLRLPVFTLARRR
ncbi:MAG: trimeric intracellular cation channel family protein [Candidatus Krumholzibacteriia bacterium]